VRRAWLALCLALVTGCGAGAYTHIERLEDGSYLLVRTKSVPFGTRATLFRCTPAGPTPDLRCVEIDSPQ